MLRELARSGPLWPSVPSCVPKMIAPVPPSSAPLLRTLIRTAMQNRIPDLILVMEPGGLSHTWETSLTSQPTQLDKHSVHVYLLSWELRSVVYEAETAVGPHFFNTELCPRPCPGWGLIRHVHINSPSPAQPVLLPPMEAHWRRKWQPTPVFLPEESHGQRSLTGYDPWGCKRLGHNWETKQPRWKPTVQGWSPRFQGRDGERGGREGELNDSSDVGMILGPDTYSCVTQCKWVCHPESHFSRL